MIKACIFDLDGVIVDTAKYHFIAWRRLANSLGFDFSEEENEKLKGVSRIESLNLILQWGGIEKTEEEKEELATRKNNWYREYILKMDSSEILEGVVPFLGHLEQKGIRMAVGSSSKNAGTILEQVGLSHRFEAIIDGTKVSRSKPDPQVFEMGAEEMGLSPRECIVFEDAPKGVDAALAGGFIAVGIGSEENLGHAQYVLPNFIGVSLQDILDGIKIKST
ncbi:MAG: beta-phosphoglucomutase [Lewinellaceae bacterium]|nr:beta-phosphoglucomutase [Phaeodactylibacter sp.]MCB0614060.1 beta-phosphoglucomutase [Phaeodactylibacter sp.]MCB9349381.1 beta-phosphoglucomutase [Lewinellaceae bacterium]